MSDSEEEEGRRGSSSRKMTRRDWDNPFWDHHFGMQDSSTRGPYTTRGRTDAVWKTLQAYGFKKSADKKKAFDGLIPTSCFEYFVRENVKEMGNILEDGQIEGNTVSELAKRIRSSHEIGYIDDSIQEKIEKEDEMELVTRALSTKGIQRDHGPNDDRESGYYTDLFYSFCREEVEQSTGTWHCRVCKGCKDWRDWHCKGCKTCKYGASIPCDKCNATEYASWRRQAGF
mmetsp:Transcript_26208/g.32307  ORF Transcript_26208/g.32307 Transcript_26208/m.32307 type:complete len:229 (-) Transcript_26208:90-776(-)